MYEPAIWRVAALSRFHTFTEAMATSRAAATEKKTRDHSVSTVTFGAADPSGIGATGSATRILNVYSPTAKKENCVLTGTPKRIVEQLFDEFDDKIGGAISQDLKSSK